MKVILAKLLDDFHVSSDQNRVVFDKAKISRFFFAQENRLAPQTACSFECFVLKFSHSVLFSSHIDQRKVKIGSDALGSGQLMQIDRYVVGILAGPSSFHDEIERNA